MKQLTKNFNEKEFACPCCGKTVINMDIVNKLQKLRDFIGFPIVITSGYRCDKYNKSIGGYP
ncbi:MAG: D-Ala-D-Ala carboxypeptidase family metallohydrolase [Eubacteriales bacterium]